MKRLVLIINFVTAISFCFGQSTTHPPCTTPMNYIKYGEWKKGKDCLDEMFIKRPELRTNSKGQYWYAIATLQQLEDSLTDEIFKDSLLILSINCFCKTLYYDTKENEIIAEIDKIDSLEIDAILNKELTETGFLYYTEIKEKYMDTLILYLNKSNLSNNEQRKYMDILMSFL